MSGLQIVSRKHEEIASGKLPFNMISDQFFIIFCFDAFGFLQSLPLSRMRGIRFTVYLVTEEIRLE
ncbi:MAG: hypothetical protein ACFCU6_16310 [Balneolaceae bacterium]